MKAFEAEQKAPEHFNNTIQITRDLRRDLLVEIQSPKSHHKQDFKIPRRSELVSTQKRAKIFQQRPPTQTGESTFEMRETEPAVAY